MNSKYFKLYSFNVPVAGKKESAIYNLQQNCIYKIPNHYCSFLKGITEDWNSLPVDASGIKSDNMRNFLKELCSKEIGFFTDSPDFFPPIHDTFYFNSQVERAIVEYSDKYDFSKLFEQLENLLCKYLEIRFENWPIRSSEDLSMLDKLERTSLRSINLVINYTKGLDMAFAIECFTRYSKLRNIIILSAPVSRKIFISEKENLIYLREGFETISEKEKLPVQKQTIVNREYFFRAKKVNPYYYGKICISKEGYIKNNLQHSESFGNINEFDVRSSLAQTKITELWNISVDQIANIRDSHLRYATIITGSLTEQKVNGLYRFK